MLAPHDPVPPKATKALPLPAAVPGSIVGGPWMVDANFKSAIQIKNLVETSAVTVSPILYLSNGAKYTLTDVQLAPGGIATVDVNAAIQTLNIASLGSLSGYVELDYNWPWVPICATIRDVDVTHSLMLYYGFIPSAPVQLPNQPAPPAGPHTTVVEGTWWKQERNVTGFVDVMNTGAQPLGAELDVSDDQGRSIASHAITIPQHGMTSISLDELSTTSASTGGLRVTYTAGNSPVLVDGGLEDQGIGYSAVVPFGLPPQAAATSNGTIAELGLMTGPADPMLRFPSDTIFTPYTVLRNISAAPLTATPTLWWMAGGTAHSAQLSPITLAPHQSRILDVPAGLAAAGFKDFAGSVNLVFAVQGITSGLLVAGGAVDQTENYVFAVLPRAVTWSAGKRLSYWSTANGDDTMVTLWNPADEPQDLVFRLDFQGGQYRFPIHLDARATQMFNVSQIVNSQVPDDQGNVIPAGVEAGSAVLMGSQGTVQHILVAVDSSVYNVIKATCGYYCDNCDGVTAYSVAANPWETSVAGTNQLNFTETWTDGGQYNVNGQSSWSSNSGAATVNTSGLVTGVSGGSATITVVDGNEPVPYSGCGYMLPPCPIGYFSPGTSSTGSVANITITGVVPSQVTIGTSGPMTITGTNFNYFSGNPTVMTVNGFSIAVNSKSADGSTLYATYYAGSCSIPVATQYIALYGAISDGGSGTSSNNWPLNIVAPQLPTPMIGFGGNNNINGSNQNVVVGQQIALTSSEGSMPDCAGSPSTYSWTIQGTFVGGYSPSNASAGVSPPVLSNPSTTVYWIYPSSNQVEYSYCTTAGFCSPTATATFGVTGPTGGTVTFTPYASSLSVATLTACTFNGTNFPGGPYLMDAHGSTGSVCDINSTTPGITYNQPTGYSNASNGSFLQVQLISNDSLTNQVGLDTQFPDPNLDDSPGMFLGTSPGTQSRHLIANFFLMWQSDTANSIPVPLGYQEWGFDGSASCSSSCSTAANWTPSTNTAGPIGSFTPSNASQTSAGNNVLVDGIPTWTTVTY